MITIDFNRIFKTDPNRPAGYRILDIGCGTGRHTGAAFRFNEVMAVGVDLNFDDVVETGIRLKNQEKIGDHGNGAYGTAVADISALPFEAHCFDLVICSEILEHIHNDQAAVSEAVRVLKPGKNFVVSVPRYLPERICWSISEIYHNTANGHVRIYKKRTLMGLLERAGLKQWGLGFAHSLHTPYWWLKCIVGPSRDDSRLVKLYHNLLILDMMKKPWITRFLDRLFNPVLGKSIVLYLRKV